MGLSHSKQKVELELDGDGTTAATPQNSGFTEEKPELWLSGATTPRQFERMLKERLYTNSWVLQLEHKPLFQTIPMMAIEGKVYSLLNACCFKHNRLQKGNQRYFPEGTQLVANSTFGIVTYKELGTEDASSFTVYKSSTSQKLLDIPYIPKFGKLDLFYPLGYLVEPIDDEERITNFVWAVNISTKPASLWLIYDYLWEPNEGEEGIATLEQRYTNYFNYDSFRPYTEEYCDLPKGFLNLGRRWDIVQVFDDIGHWQPSNPYRNKPKFEMANELGPTLRVVEPHPSYFGL
ncbi:MAG: hypothetical protein Q9209_007614 [Squamulea sp. 1 TL-2023]